MLLPCFHCACVPVVSWLSVQGEILIDRLMISSRLHGIVNVIHVGSLHEIREVLFCRYKNWFTSLTRDVG